ncbi:diguanylate cyclase (GGDEF)-like protein [Rarobacter incanus]|uniref:Diguanylate cyclase (GGDEF)-like protein n=1 Tax=Rarobacter incanus TaxID=153494 RepID=A0A542SMX5_9MICO|nr:diguanylate cyclase (GGDEF)-like protein [Rarobacter incanus]
MVSAEMPVSELELLFRAERLRFVGVAGNDPNSFGLITRAHYGMMLTGRLGYGRAVHSRRRVEEITDFAPLVLGPEVLIADAAARAMARGFKRRYDPIVVAGEQWRYAESGDVTRALVSALSARTRRDALTGIPTRLAVMADLARRCEKAAGGRARIALLLVRVRALGKINAAYGSNGGDAVLRAVSESLGNHRAPGAEVGRISGRVFSVAVSLPDADELTIAASVDAIRESQVRGLACVPRGIPQSVWPDFNFGVSWTSGTITSADDLMRVAEERLRADRRR